MLDVLAYSKLVPTQLTEENEDKIFRPFVAHEDFASRLDGLQRDLVYLHQGETFSFEIKYSRYNQWRSYLANLVGTTPESVWKGEKPPAFGELIDFPDNEGTIGPVVCAKLAQDFADWQERAEQATFVFTERIVPPDYFLVTYNRFRRAFELARDSGAVDFG